MNSLRYILEVDTTDYDKKRTSDPTSKPKKKKNVLFIGDANTKSADSYARQLINSGVVTGEIRASFEGTAQEILKLVRAHNADNYNIISIQYSNIFPQELNNDIDALRAALDEAKKYGAKVILISNPSKKHVPYAHVKYETDLDIWNWITKQQNKADYTIDIRRITDDSSFFDKTGLLFNKDTQNVITQLWLDVLKDIEPNTDSQIIKKQKARKSLNKPLNKKWNFKKGEKNKDLLAIQKRLEKLGYDIQDSEIGIMNDSTFEAIKKFQVLNSLAVTGQINNEFVNKLNSSAAIEYSEWRYAMKNVLQPEEQDEQGPLETPVDSDTDTIMPVGNVSVSRLNNIPKNASEFIAMWKDIAKTHMNQYKIPASITLAQAALESGWGKSGLATKYNNFFGITGTYKGNGIKLRDSGGKMLTFRVYPEATNSFEDHADLLVRRYTPSQSNPTVKDWAKTLEERDYATPGYARKLLNLITQYSLDEYDSNTSTVTSDSISTKYNFGAGTGQLPGASSGGDGGDWAGSLPKLISILPAGTWKAGHKRSRKTTKDGNTSDHYIGKTDSYAIDLMLDTAFGGDKNLATNFAIAVANKAGKNITSWDPYINSYLNITTPDGYRVQIIWLSMVGGNHYDHVHLGVRKLENTV
jgi:flagellum-specific peptidoglycan hydrolase FlgJ